MSYVDLLVSFVLPMWNAATTEVDCTYLGLSAGARCKLCSGLIVYIGF
jgi:hypothetical protein